MIRPVELKVCLIWPWSKSRVRECGLSPPCRDIRYNATSPWSENLTTRVRKASGDFFLTPTYTTSMPQHDHQPIDNLAYDSNTASAIPLEHWSMASVSSQSLLCVTVSGEIGLTCNWYIRGKTNHFSFHLYTHHMDTGHAMPHKHWGRGV